MASPSRAPKLRALHDGDLVSVTIDSGEWPYHVLSIRGPITIRSIPSVPPEYVAAATRYFGEQQGAAWVAQLPADMRMVRVAVTPQWVSIIDFETRFPSALSA
jgi:hypothetical protein